MLSKLSGLSLLVAVQLSFSGVLRAEDSAGGQNPKLRDRLEIMRTSMVTDAGPSNSTADTRSGSMRGRPALTDVVAGKGYRSNWGRPQAEDTSEPVPVDVPMPETGPVPRRIVPSTSNDSDSSTTDNSVVAPRRSAPPAQAPAPAPTTSRRPLAPVQQQQQPQQQQQLQQQPPQQQQSQPQQQQTSQPTSSRRTAPAALPVSPTTADDATPAGSGGEPTVNSTRTYTTTAPNASTAAPSGGVLFGRKSPLLRAETVGPTKTVMGKPSTYVVRIQNLGDVAADGVIVRLQIPDWVEVASTQPSRGAARPVEATQGGAVLQWQIDHLEGRGGEEMRVSLVPRKSQRFSLSATWTSTPATSEAMIEVQEPKLEIAVVGPHEVLYGETKTYRLTVANPGTGDAEQVAIQLMSVDGGTQPTASQSLGTIPAGQSKTLEIELTARQAGNIKISAQATADGGLRTDAVQQVLVRRGSVKVTVEGPAMKYAGTPTKYTIHVSNPGNAIAEGVVVEAALPPGAQHVEASQSGKVSTENGKVTWSLESLGAGQQQVLELDTTLNSAGENQVRVSATAKGDLTDTSSTVTNVEALADLKLEVTDPSGPVAVGDELVYEIHIRNRGTKSANDVGAVAFFSEGVEPTRVTGAEGRVDAGQVIFQPIASLAAGSEAVLKVSARASRPGTLVFRAEVKCKTIGTHLVAEETTLFYEPTAGARPQREAQRAPQPTPADAGLQPLTR